MALIKDFQAQVKTTKPSAKWKFFSNLKSRIFSVFDVILTVLDLQSVFPIQIWICFRNTAD